MLLPRLYNRDFFDDFFDFGWPQMPNVEKQLYGKRAGEVMKTDVKETEDSYTVSASKGLEKDEKNEEGKYIRRERYTGNVRRSFYVGENLTEDDIKASFEDGILKLDLPKKENKPQVETRHIVSID